MQCRSDVVEFIPSRVAYDGVIDALLLLQHEVRDGERKIRTQYVIVMREGFVGGGG